MTKPTLSSTPASVEPDALETWFPAELQRYYVSILLKRVGLTRRRSECFIRLWAYLMLKQQQALGQLPQQPITRLTVPEGLMTCTHREAAELFYSDSERGSDRAAGMMIDKLVDLGLVEKSFDGNTIQIRIRSLPELLEPPKPEDPVRLQIDDFNPRTDAIPVATFLARNYNWMNKSTTAVPQKIARLLRTWSRQYPKGMRVLRRCDNLHPVGFYVLFPVAAESEDKFFLPPGRGLHLSTQDEVDPFKMAPPGDPDCSAIFVRSWMIDRPYMQPEHVYQFVEDAQGVLAEVQKDFPNVCDLYALTIHPVYEEMTQALGFQQIGTDPQLSIYWMYIALDRFMALNIQQALLGPKP